MKYDKLYNELGVDASASADDIKRAYRSRSKMTHPDAGGNDEKFAATKHAYDVLSDPTRRHRYDKSGDESQSSPNSVEQEALGLLSQIMFTIVRETPALIALEGMDICALFLDTLQARVDKLEEQLKAFRIPKARLLKLSKRFKRKQRNPGPNMMEEIIQGHICQLGLQVAGVEGQLAIVRCAQNIVKGYEFKVDSSVQDVAKTFVDPFASLPRGTFFHFR